MARHEILRIYDDAVFKFVQNKVKDAVAGRDLSDHVHMATVDRPFGFEIPTTEDKKTGKVDIDLAKAAQMLETPRVTVTRFDFQYSMARNNTNRLRRGTYTDANQDYVWTSKYPRPWDIFYQIDIRARRRNLAQSVFQWWLYHPDPVRVINIDFCYPWGTKGVSLQFSQITDQTIYETEETLRYYQYVIPFTMEAYMFEVFDNPSDIPLHTLDSDDFTTRRRVVKSVDVNFRECGSGALLDVLPGAFELQPEWIPKIGPNPPCCP